MHHDKSLGTLISETVKDEGKIFENKPKVLEFEKASKELDKLIQQGLAKKREYNLLSITDAHLHRVMPNEFQSSAKQQTIKSNINNVL